MNKYIEEYLEKRKAERQAKQLKESQDKVQKLTQKLQIGEREYNEDTTVGAKDDFPFWDREKQCSYRYTIGEITMDDYNALSDLMPEEEVPVEPAERSGWYIFALIMIIVGGLAVLITLIAVAADDSRDKSWLPFWISLVSYLFIVGFFGIIMLLSQIKEVLDNMHNKMK